MTFDGSTYQEDRDHARLLAQLDAVRELMIDGQWRTLAEIRTALDLPADAAVDSRLRDLRKSKFGGYLVQHKYVRRGVYAYRVLPQVTGQGDLLAGVA